MRGRTVTSKPSYKVFPTGKARLFRIIAGLPVDATHPLCTGKRAKTSADPPTDHKRVSVRLGFAGCASSIPCSCHGLPVLSSAVIFGFMSEVTRILSAIDQGDAHAAEKLLPLVYDELRKLAANKMAQEAPGQTIQATALVHEAYLRLVDVDKAQHWNSRGHFFAAAADAMRRILVEQARHKQRHKHGGKRKRVDLEEALGIAEPAPDDLLSLHEALGGLERIDSLAAKLVELRFFAGLNMPQAAEALGISLRTAERNWTYARTWLHREMDSSP
jgi:RNA polymerase sigma factor (TIGR02999 family)